MFTSNYLEEGEVHTREYLRQKFSIKDATLNNGVFKPSGHQSIWLFVTEQKTSDRPQPNDLLEGDILYWDGQLEGRTDRQIIDHQIDGNEILVFYRKHRKEFPGSGFRYEGKFQYISHTGSRPTHFVLQKVDEFLETVKKDIQALKIEESREESNLAWQLTNKYERNPKLRARAIKIHGTRCQACNFSFAETYESHGENFIEVHHLFPASKYASAAEINPDTDMVVLCANCHRMVHRNPNKPLSIDELQHIIHIREKAHE